MKGLLLRLSAVDVGAEAAVRVIAYFDALVERGATTAELLRAAAALAECPAGLHRTGEEPMRMAPGGAPLRPAEPVTASGSAELAPGAGRVWLERAGGPGPLDDLVLERLAISARLLTRPERRTPAPHLADPALVELVLSGREAPEDRARALSLLGLDTATAVRVVAVATDGPDAATAAVALVTRGRPLRTARVAVIGGLAAMILQPRSGAEAVVPDLRTALADRSTERGTEGTGGLRIGVGAAVPGLEARTSWAQAQLAVRFAVPERADDAVVDHGALGSSALLAEIPADRLRAQPDVAVLEAMAATPSGALDVAALEAFCRTGSLRQAAASLHLHHSSVAARLAHVEDASGWRLDEPDGRFRARFALLARRLAAGP